MNDDSRGRGRTLRLGGSFVRGIWCFPVLLTVLVLLLTALKISGSSLGAYHVNLYGAQRDSHLLFNNPQPIRSDEFSVNTQLTIAQDAAGYPRINPNIGDGADVSIIVDVPYKDWSAVFKPQNLAFLALPFDHAFAFKWWFIGYLLVLSCYFFVLALMPKRRLFAVGLSLGLFFSPFVQWWYQTGTLGPIAYMLFAATALVFLLRSKRLLTTIGWGALLTYVLTCFALIVYPPFQIACALATAAFAVGYLVEAGRTLGRRLLLRQLAVVAGALAAAGALVAAFVASRLDVVTTVQNTAYPGQRLQPSGGYDAAHVFSAHTSFGLQSGAKAALYQIPTSGLTNQSEDSNFLLILPYLALPAFFLLYRSYRARRGLDWPLLLINIVFLVMLAWLFVPHLDILGKLLLLERVPHTRLLIGLGLLNVLGLVLFVRRLDDEDAALPGRNAILGYTALVLLIQVLLSVHVMRAYPGFMQARGLILSLVPMPLAVYFVLRRNAAWAAAVLLAFSVAVTAFIHPLYRGTGALTSTPLSGAIRAVHAEDPTAVWALEGTGYQNFAYMNGARSLSGLYPYPQLELWRTADGQRQQEFTYNRYAHVTFVFDRDPARAVPTTFALPSADHVEITTEPCGTFLRQQHVGYLVTRAPLTEPCLEPRTSVPYPSGAFLIYRVR